MNKQINKQKNLRRQLIGVVVSTKMRDTIVVSVSHSFQHPKYKKIVRRDKKFLVSAKSGDVSVGDTVKIEEVPPVSKRKHFRLIGKVTV